MNKEYKEGTELVLMKIINSFFDIGDTVIVVADWGDMLYVHKKGGIHRVAIDKDKDHL